jgi:hypothetical protein
MSLVDLFNPSFLMFLGILVLVVALLVVYFESKFREQNHKIASMLSIVSSVAEELNNMRGAINLVGGSINNDNSPNIIELNSSFNSNSNFEQIKRMDLIEVSDDEEDDESVEDLEEEDLEEEDLEEDSVDEDSIDEEEDSEEEDDDFVEADLEEVKDIKVLKLSVSGTNINLDINHEEIDDLHNDEEIDDLHNDEEIEFDDNESIVSIDATSIHDIKIANFDLKSISFDTNLEEKNQMNSSEYKKLSANKLKNIAIEKGLTTKSSKLSKQELLILLKTQ